MIGDLERLVDSADRAKQNGYAQVGGYGQFVISGWAAGTYDITLNSYRPPPQQAVRLLPTLKQSVKVTDANESSVVFTLTLSNR